MKDKQKAFATFTKTERCSFAFIGAFIFQFSQLEFSIRHKLAALLELSEDQFDVVTSRYDFVALCGVTKKLLDARHKEDKKYLSKIKKVFSECKTLNDEARLPVVHGLWTDGRKGGLACRYVSRTSLDAQFLLEDEENKIQGWIEAAKILMIKILELKV
ncbi:MAG: hypothetical protein WC521_03740 [Bdellovibrionales bacterium]